MSLALKSRLSLKQPVWRGEEAWENTARGPAVAGPSSGQLPQVVRLTPPPGPASLFPDHDDDTRSVSDGEGDAFNDHTQTPPPVQVPPPVAAPGVVALPTAGIPNVLPATTYTIVPPAQVGRVLSLTAQHPHIVHTLRATFIKIEADLAFLDAFPDGLGRTLFVTNAMDAAAAGLGHTGLQERFRADRPFLRILSALVSTYCSPHVRLCFYAVLPSLFSLSNASAPSVEPSRGTLMHMLSRIMVFSRGSALTKSPSSSTTLSTSIRILMRYVFPYHFRFALTVYIVDSWVEARRLLPGPGRIITMPCPVFCVLHSLQEPLLSLLDTSIGSRLFFLNVPMRRRSLWRCSLWSALP